MILEILTGAFIGGFLLNLAPCILPVVALKILTWAKIGESSSGRIAHGLVYCAGLVTSFLVLGLITAGIRLAGGSVLFGGLFLSNIWFVAALGCITGFIGLYQLGAIGKVWEAIKNAVQSLKINPVAYKPGLWDRIASKGQEWALSVRLSAPLTGSFLNGALTTLLGSACCGPMLAYAMGMALAANPLTIIAAFVVAGLGMAAPYLLLSFMPGCVKLIPRSGRWIKGIQIGAGVLMVLTSLWLFSLILL